MSSEIRKEKLANLIEEYNSFKKTGRLDLTSEETIRTWLNQLLEIFGWDVRDTSQILQEKVLSKSEKERVKDIGSQNTRPDYTFKIAKQKLSFLDAKDITVKLLNDSDAAFQIKSYGWSILAPCAFISNFEEFAIYDCTYEPEKGQDPNLGRLYFTIDTLLDNYQILEDHLLKDNIYMKV
jgi:type I site-specific restriction endonuclease